jgi:hypothetical protein
MAHIGVHDRRRESGKAVSRQADNPLGQCSQWNRHESSPRLPSSSGAHVQPHPQKKVARAYRVEGSIVLYPSAARSSFTAERPPLGSKPWWSRVFGAPLFLRTLLRLVLACPHLHKGPPIGESIPPNLHGCRSVYGRRSYITCLDCGQKFAYNHKTGRLVDFWGVHDAEALAGVRRRFVGFFSALQDLAAMVGRLNMRIPKSEPVSSLYPLGSLTKGQ